jgi:aryl-phospho-beta-D-glucosidase BglC (GH1 family)
MSDMSDKSDKEQAMRAALVLLIVAAHLSSCAGTASDPADLASSPDVLAVGDAGDAGDAPAVDSAQADTPGLDPAPEYGMCEPNEEPFPVRPAVEIPASLPWLHVEGKNILDEEGNLVALRGFNFGGWLSFESWLPGLGEMDETELLEELTVQSKKLGLAQLLLEAQAANALDFLLERKTQWVIVQEWRDWCFEHATEGQLAAVAKLWEWFDQQPWLREEENVWRWFDKRFGHAKSEQLREAFHDHYITELDVERFAALGLNLVRLPVWYRTLETAAKGENRYRGQGWMKLHEAALWARKHKVYIALDLHGVPGGQSCTNHQGLADGGHFFEHPDCIQEAARMWEALAAYFEDDPHIAMYDLLNEPMSCTNAEDYRTVHQALYDAVRKVDQKHIVAIEDGFKPASMLTSPAEMGWANAMYSFHFYPWGATTGEGYLNGTISALAAQADLSKRYNCPVLAGEFSAASGKKSGSWGVETTDKVLALLNAKGIHWTLWSWKFYGDWCVWGLYHPGENAGQRLPVKEAPFEQILGAFEKLDSANCVPLQDFEAVVKKNAASPPSPLDWGAERR